MGNGTNSTTDSRGDPTSLPLVQDLVDILSALPTTPDKAAPGPEAPQVESAAAAKDLKKLVKEVKGLDGLVDKDGNPIPEKAAEASQLLAKEAAARKDKDPRAAARLLQDAVTINPDDKDLRVQAGRAWMDWAATQKDPQVAEVAAKRGIAFVQNIDTSKGQNPDVAKAKFELGKRAMAFCAANNNWPEAQTYLQVTIQNGTPDQVKELLQGFEDNPHPELFPMIPDKDLHQSPAQFFADTLVDAGRPQEARDVYLHEADRFKDSNPQLAEGMKFLADKIELDPAQEFTDLGKWDDADNAKVDEDINALGYYKDPTKIDSAKGRIREEVQHFLFSDEMKHVELGSSEYKQKMAKFLGTETEFQFLPIADKKDVMKAEYSVSQEPYKYKLELEDGDSNWNYLRCDTDLDRKARYYKFAGDDMLGEGHSNAVIPPGTNYSDRVKSAIRLYQKSLDLQKEGDNDHGDTAGACRLQLAHSYTLLAQGNVGPQLSKILFNEAAKELGTLSSDHFSADWKTMQAAGDLCLASGHPSQARQYYMEALGMAQKAGVPDYVKTTVDYVHQLDFRQAYRGEQDFKNTPIGRGLQKATDAEAKQMVEDRHKQENGIPTPGENLMDAIMRDSGKPPDPVRKGVKPSEVVAWYKEARPGVEVSEDTLTAKNYVAYAMAHGDKFRGDLEQVYGKLPFNDKGELDPEFKKMAEQSHEDRTHKAEDLAKQHGLEPNSDAFKKFVSDEMSKKDPMDDAFHLLLYPLNNSDLSGAFYAINEIRGKTLEANAQVSLKPEDPKSFDQSCDEFQQAGQAFANAYDLNGETQDLYDSAKGFYQAGQIAKLSGHDDEARALFDKGVQALQFGGTELLNDPQAMKLLGDGLMGEGKLEEARNAYNTAQEPLLQYYGARSAEPPAPELYTQCALLSDQCNKMAYTQKELGSVLDEKAVLEQKFAKGPLSPTDQVRFDQIQKGQGFLDKIDGLHYPPKPVSSTSNEPDEPIAISNLRNDLIAALKAGDTKKINDLEATVQHQVENVETLQMADAMRRDAILPQLPPQVQDYIRRTNDWSILKVSDADATGASHTALTLGGSIPGPYNEDNLPNKDWNAEALNNTPINKALVEWDKSNPEQAKQVRETLKLFGTNGLVYDLRDYKDLDALDSKVKEIKTKLFQTDEQGELPLDPQDPHHQAHLYKPSADIQTWFKDAKEIDLRDKPEEWMSSHLQDTRGSLELTARTERALETVKKDYQDTKDGLDAAQKSGDTEKANALSQHLEELKGRITELKGNFGKTLQSQTEQFGTDLESFGKHSKTLKKLGEGDQYAYQPQLEGAQGKLQAAIKNFGELGEDADPGAVLDAMIADTKQLAVAQGTLLKGISLVHLSCIQNFKPGYTASIADMGGEEAKNKKPDMKELEASKPGWHSDPKWNAAISKINEGSLNLQDLDADKIEKFLSQNLEVLKTGDSGMFDDMPTTLGKGINAQVEQIRKFKQEKLDAGQTNTYEYDQLINNYLEAQKALEQGNTDRALALFKVATDSKRRSGVMKDFENLKEDEMMDNLFLEVGIVTAATLLTAGTMSVVAGGAVAAVAEGTASTLTMVGTGLLEGAAFVTWDMTLRSYLFGAEQAGAHFGAAHIQNPWEEIHGPEDLVWKIVMNAGMLKALHFAGECYQGLTLGSRVLSRVSSESLLETASEVELSSNLMRKLLQEEMGNLGKGGENLLGKGLSKLGKGAYHLGSFGVEFGSMQAWSVLESSLDSLRHAAHGDKLAWSNLDDKISQIFDPKNLALSCAQLIGLKLGGFGTAPFMEAIQKSDLDVAQKEQFKSFFKIKEQFETDLTTAMDKAKAEGKPFVLSPELRGAAKKLMAAGQILDLPEPLAKQIEGSEDQIQQWRSMKKLLTQLDDYSGKKNRLVEPGGNYYSGRGSEDGVNLEPIAPTKGTAPQGQPDVFFVGRGRSPAVIVPSEKPEWKVKSVEKKGNGYEVTLTNLRDPQEELTAQCAKAPQIGIGTDVAVAGIGGGGSAIPDNLQPIRQRKAIVRHDEALDKFLDTLRHSEPEPIALDDADIISVEGGDGRKRLRQAADGLRGKEDGSQRGLAEQFGAVDMFNDGTRSFLRRVAANPSLDVTDETRRMGEVLKYLNDSVLSQVDNLSPQQMQILRETLFRQVMDGNTTMEDAQVLGKQLKDGDSHIVILKPGETADHPYAYQVEKGKAEPFQGDEGSLGARDLQSQEYYQHLARTNPEAVKDPKAKEAVETFIDGLNKNEKYPEIVRGLREGSLVLVYQDGKVEAKKLEEIPVTAGQKEGFYSALKLENRGIENQPQVQQDLDSFLEKNFGNAALSKAMLDNVKSGKIILTFANGEFYFQTKENLSNRIQTAGQTLDGFIQKNQAKYGKLDPRITKAFLEAVARDPNFPMDEIGTRFETTLQGLNAAREGIRNVPKDQQVPTLEALTRALAAGAIEPKDIEAASGKGLDPAAIHELEGKLGIERGQWLVELTKDPNGFKEKMRNSQAPEANPAVVKDVVDSYGSVDKAPKFSNFDTGANTLMGMIQKPETAYDYQAQKKLLSALRYQFGTDPQYQARLEGLGNFIAVAKEKETACNADFAAGSRVEPKLENGRVQYIRISREEVNGEWVTKVNKVDAATYHAFLRYQDENLPLPQYALDGETKNDQGHLVLNIETGNYELVNDELKTLRVLTDDEVTRDFKPKEAATQPLGTLPESIGQASKIVQQHFPALANTELGNAITNLLVQQFENTSRISFLSPDSSHLDRVLENADKLLNNPQLQEGLRQQFGENYPKVVQMAALLSKIGFGHPELDPADNKTYSNNRLYAADILENQLKPMLMKELDLDEGQYRRFVEAIVREGSFGLGTEDTPKGIDAAVGAGKIRGLDLEDLFQAGGEIQGKYTNPLTTLLTVASEVDVSKQRLQPWQTNVTLMKALVRIASDPVIQELYLEKAALDLKKRGLEGDDLAAFEKENVGFYQRFDQQLQKVIFREILDNPDAFIKQLASEYESQGRDKTNALGGAQETYRLIRKNMKAVNSDSYLWFIGSYGIRDISINEKGEIILISPEDTFPTMGAAANLPHVRDFHKTRLSNMVEQINQAKGTNFQIKEVSERENPELFQQIQSSPKADTHTHLKMAVDFDLYIWNGTILSMDPEIISKFEKYISGSDQLLTGILSRGQKLSPEDQKQEVFELKKVFEVARDTTLDLYNFVQDRKRAKKAPVQDYDAIKNKDRIVEDAKAELSLLKGELDEKVKQEGRNPETDRQREEIETIQQKIDLYERCKFFVKNAFNFQEGALTDFVPHFMAASNILKLSKEDELPTLKRITREVLNQYQSDNVRYFEPRFNIGGKGTREEVLTVIQAYEEWKAGQLAKNPNAVIPEMKIILSITKFGDQDTKAYDTRVQHKTDSMQTVVDILRDARNREADGDKPYEDFALNPDSENPSGYAVKPSDLLKYLSGVDSAGVEEHNPPSLFYNAFGIIEDYNAEVREAGRDDLQIGATFHVSESNTDVSPESALRYTLDALFMKPLDAVDDNTPPIMTRLGHSIVPGIGDFESLRGTKPKERVSERLDQIDHDLQLLELGLPLQSVNEADLKAERDSLLSQYKTKDEREKAVVELPAYDQSRLDDLELRAAFVRDEMIRTGVVVETNPTSNLGISPYITGYENHTLKTYLKYEYGDWAKKIVEDLGNKSRNAEEQKRYETAVAYLETPAAKEFDGRKVRVTINTDDLTLFGTNMTEEFYRMAVSLGLDSDQINDLMQAGFDSPIRKDRPRTAQPSPDVQSKEDETQPPGSQGKVIQLPVWERKRLQAAALSDERQAAREKILLRLYDELPKGLSDQETTRRVTAVLDAFDLLKPALDKIAKEDRDSVELGIARHIIQNKLSIDDVSYLADQIARGEVQLLPDSGPEGFRFENLPADKKTPPLFVVGDGRAPALIFPSENAEWKVHSVVEQDGKWIVTLSNLADPKKELSSTSINKPAFDVGGKVAVVYVGGGGSAFPNGVPLPPAVSGKLPVGQLRRISVPADGSKFTIGRDPSSSLRFDDNQVSRTHATLLYSAEEGCFYIADGAMGTKDRSLNGVLVNGVPIPPGQKFVKVPAQGQDNYISIHGADFKLEVPSTPVVGVQLHGWGFLTTNVGGQDYALRVQRKGDTLISTTGTLHARILEAHVSETDSQDRIALRLETSKWGDPTGQKSELYLMVTQGEAAALGLKVNPDGSIDPASNHDEILFGPFNEKDVRGPAIKQAALNPGGNPVPAVQVPPPPPAPKLKSVRLQDSGDSSYQLQAYNIDQGLDGISRLGTIIRFETDRRGKTMMLVEVGDDLRPDAPKKTLAFKVSLSKAAELGLIVDRYGNLTPDSPRDLRVLSMEVPVQVNGRKFTFQALEPDTLEYVQFREAEGNPLPMMGRVEAVRPVPGKPDQVVLDVKYSPSGYGDPYQVSVPMSSAEAMKLGVRFDAQGPCLPEEPVRIELKSAGPIEMPDYDLDGPLPEGVTAVIQDNKPDQPRRGQIDVDQPSSKYGTASGQTNEGIGYKDRNEDAIVQGDNWAAVVDGMGGHGAGDKASEIVSKALAHYLEAHRNDPDPKQVMHDALVYAGDAVNASPYGKSTRAGAVAVVHMVVTNPDGSQKIIIGHVGDAGALVIGKDGKIKYQTSDQGPAGSRMQREIDQGKSHDDADIDKRANPSANLVGSCLGAGLEADPIVREFPLEEGDRVVMYSDGLGDAMSSIELANRVMRAKTAKDAEQDIFKTGLDNMTDLSDALEELKPGKRLPITKEGYIDAKGNIYDLPEGGKVVGQLKAGDPGWETVQEHYGTLQPGERKPYPRNAYVDGSGDIYDALTDGNRIDHYKNDNLAVHVYFHNPEAETQDRDTPHLPDAAKPSSDLPKVGGQTPSQLMQFDMNHFEVLGQSLVGKIPGLTPELEQAFRDGDVINPELRDVSNGRLVLPYQIVHRPSGASTMRWKQATEEQYQVYKTWQSYTGFPDKGSKVQGISKGQLEAYGKDRDLQITGSGTEIQNEYILGVLQQLPDSFLQAKSPEGYRYLQGIRLGTGRVGMRGAAMGSAFENDQVYLYSGALQGPRQNMLGLLLHEMGHSTGHRYALTESENQTSGNQAPPPPDSSIPLEVRQKMHDCHLLLGKKGQIYGLDWMGGKDYRITYTKGSFQEFIAEFHLQYVADGAGLRKHIESIQDPEAKAAYQYVYNELKTRVFGDKEYGLEPNAGAQDGAPQRHNEVKSVLTGLSGVDNRWVYKMPADLPLAMIGREALMGQAGSDQVSADHARIWRSGGSTFIEDSTSLNGTQVLRDGKVVWYSRGRRDVMKSNFALQPGDKIILGKIVEVEFYPS